MTIGWYLLIVATHVGAVGFGVIVHMRWLDRKLVPPAKPTPTQKLPAVNGGKVI